jgi:hypothetical protein
MNRFFPIVLFSLLTWPSVAAGAEAVPDPNRGLYAIWTKPGVGDDLAFIKGGQVLLQWRWVQPAEDRYDFSLLHRQLEKVARQGRVTTVQLNANELPAFLFEKVPHTRTRPMRVQDNRGTLQYWHPAYVKAYTDLIARFAREVKSSPYSSSVIGVRLSYDAIGTEWMIILPEDRDLKQWVVPAGVTPAPEWNEEIAAAYRRTVQEAYIHNFGPDLRVFLRSGVATYPTPDLQSIETAEKGQGKLGFFTTAAEMEPRGANMVARYKDVFLRFCRSGKLVCYSEPLSAAGGEGVATDGTGRVGRHREPRWCTAAQWNYWRILSDLNAGFSMIALYGPDIENAGQAEYRDAFAFAGRYAGYHASPSVSPGAWVALREGSLQLKGDYSFLMRRLDGPAMKAEQKIGPDDQRFGAWALTLAKGSPANFALDPAFARSLAGKKATVRVTYLDRNAGTFTVLASGQKFQTSLGDSGRWKAAEFPLDRAAFAADGAGAHLSVESDSSLTLHMLEVAR